MKKILVTVVLGVAAVAAAQTAAQPAQGQPPASTTQARRRTPAVPLKLRKCPALIGRTRNRRGDEN